MSLKPQLEPFMLHHVTVRTRTWSEWNTVLSGSVIKKPGRGPAGGGPRRDYLYVLMSTLLRVRIMIWKLSERSVLHTLISAAHLLYKLGAWHRAGGTDGHLDKPAAVFQPVVTSSSNSQNIQRFTSRTRLEARNYSAAACRHWVGTLSASSISQCCFLLISKS